jgi:hypothetical protein
MTIRLNLLTTATAAFLVHPLGSVYASTITLNFSGFVTDMVTSGSGSVPATVQVGTPISGRLTYDPDLASTSPSNVWQFYDFALGEAALTVDIAGHTWATADRVQISTQNNFAVLPGLPEQDALRVTGHATGALTFPGALGANDISLTLVDQSASVALLSSTALPTSDDDLNLSFASTFGSIQTYSAGFQDLTEIYFSIDPRSITFQSEPPTILPDIARTNFSDYFLVTQSNGDLGRFDFQFDWELADDSFRISVDIQLTGDVEAASSYIPIWEAGIEAIWSNGANFSDGVNVFDFVFDVNFVSGPGHYSVEVVDGPGRTDTDTWFLDLGPIMGWSQDYHDETAAHEFGHFLGLYDEYIDGFTDPTADFDDICRNETVLGIPIPLTRTGTFCNSLMADLGPVQERYYEHLLDILEGRLDLEFIVAMAPTGYYDFDYPQLLAGAEGVLPVSPSQVPVPLPILSLALALLSLLAVNKRVRP